MVMVDTSVWIDYVNGTTNTQVEKLHSLLNSDRILIGDLIITELLQGFSTPRELKVIQNIISLLEYHDMVGRDIAEKSALNYNYLRKNGITVRKTIDVIIGTFCIENKIPLLHNNKDFVPMEKHLHLLSI